MKFEGEYFCNNKHNGKGFDEKCKIIYELKNGNSTIEEYDEDGKLMFEGEYFNGKRNGKGKEYDDNENLIFEGTYLNGERKEKMEIEENFFLLKN